VMVREVIKMLNSLYYRDGNVREMVLLLFNKCYNNDEVEFLHCHFNMATFRCPHFYCYY